MDKIHIAVVLHPAQQRTFARCLNLIPPHMGYLQRLTFHLHIRREMLHSTGDNPKSGVGTKLFAAFKQHLQAQTYPQEGASAGDMCLYRFDKSTLVQIGNAVTKSSNSGEHQAFGMLYFARIICHFSTKPQMFKRLMDAAQVSHTDRKSHV